MARSFVGFDDSYRVPVPVNVSCAVSCGETVHVCGQLHMWTCLDLMGRYEFSPVGEEWTIIAGGGPLNPESRRWYLAGR